jgi:hypothetical protein
MTPRDDAVIKYDVDIVRRWVLVVPLNLIPGPGGKRQIEGVKKPNNLFEEVT